MPGSTLPTGMQGEGLLLCLFYERKGYSFILFHLVDWEMDCINAICDHIKAFGYI